ncbi:MAG TPA: 50S ribosomal protein L7/L12 [Candidatus Paceibacterota bacterium]
MEEDVKVAAEAAEVTATEEVTVPEKFKTIVKAIEEMSVVDLNELVKVFEKKFGVSAAAVAVAGPAAGGAGAAEEKTEFTLVLTSDGGNKIPVMKVIKEALGLGLAEAKTMVESLPATVKENGKKEEIDALKKQIEEAGGKVEVK